MPAPPASSNAEMIRLARFSPCGEHRLLLERHWHAGALAGFVMLNPSTADAERDDPTIRRCIGFARSMGCGGILIANLFTLRATDPRDLVRAPAHARNAAGADAAMREVARRCSVVIEAWGAHRTAVTRVPAARRLLREAPARAVLGRTRDGAPRHPLYLPASAPLLDADSGRPLRHHALAAPQAAGPR